MVNITRCYFFKAMIYKVLYNFHRRSHSKLFYPYRAISKKNSKNLPLLRMLRQLACSQIHSAKNRSRENKKKKKSANDFCIEID